MRRALGIVPLAMLLLAGCGGMRDQPEPAASAPSATADALLGRTFTGTEVTVDGERRELAGGTELTLSFGLHGEIGFSGGCNGSSSTVDITDGRLEIPAGEVTSTLMGCDDARQEQDALLYDLLEQGPAWRLDGSRLTVSADGTEIVLHDTTPPNTALAGTTWTVGHVVDTARRFHTPARPTILTFTEDTVAVDTGCNTGSVGYTVSDRTLRFDGGLALTRKACAPEVQELERFLADALRDEVSYQVDDVRLSLAHPSRAGLTADRAPVVEPSALAGRAFESVSVTVAGKPYELIEGTAVRVEFRADGSTRLSAGCNQLEGRYGTAGGRLGVTDVVTTDMACPGRAGEQDDWLLSLVKARPEVRLDRAELTLTAAGEIVVVLRETG